MDLSRGVPLIGPSGNQVIAGNPAPIMEPRIDLMASWEDIMALGRKERGDVAEARTVAKLMELGIIVAKPLAENAAPWDLIVVAGRKISRLQVKSAWSRTERGYWIGTCGGSGRPYDPKDVDFLVGYVAPEDTWFVFPTRCVQVTHLCIQTDPDWELARYRERWDLLFPKGQRPVARVQ